MPHLENWCIGGAEKVDPYYTAPEMIERRLYGIVYDHPSPFLLDGEYTHTSSLLSIDYINKKATTRNNEYTLGKPDPNWLKWCKDNNIEYSHVLQENENAV
jgi:hypothetical protein